MYQTIETERLIIRQFEDDDMTALHEIMKKPEVMYAWEHGFSFEETQEWLKQQQNRYKKNGLGEQAVILKATGALIGAAGLLELDLEGEPATEIGYLFDNRVWGNGFATEAARAFVDLAFEKLRLDRLHCTIRPENLPSIKVAERLGFKRISEYVKVYNGKEMPHLIFVLEKAR
jgi:RimJ/RimL family protein N-acetyltransferase